MGKRTSLMIAYDILQVAIGGSNKTYLVYQCNLNFGIIKKWLSRLMTKGLLEFNAGPPKTWITTPKGLKFIYAMDKVKTIWDDGTINLTEMGLKVSMNEY